ncbi:putative RNA-directed DNA polymerase, partial [Tanacetum coccineum]
MKFAIPGMMLGLIFPTVIIINRRYLYDRRDKPAIPQAYVAKDEDIYAATVAFDREKLFFINLSTSIQLRFLIASMYCYQFGVNQKEIILPNICTYKWVSSSSVLYDKCFLTIGDQPVRPICPSRMMAITVAGNSLTSAQSCQNVKRSTPDAPANASLSKYSGTGDIVLRKRGRVGNASTCRDVCNLGAASDSMQQHICTDKHQAHGGSLANADHLTFAAQGKLASGTCCEKVSSKLEWTKESVQCGYLQTLKVYLEEEDKISVCGVDRGILPHQWLLQDPTINEKKLLENFFDGIHGYGNPRKSAELNKNRSNGAHFHARNDVKRLNLSSRQAGYSCFYFQTYSLWMSFGVYATGLLFETASIVSFLLIPHGYCITSERLSVPERRAIAVIGCVFYLILVGQRAFIPYFSELDAASFKDFSRRGWQIEVGTINGTSISPSPKLLLKVKANPNPDLLTWTEDDQRAVILLQSSLTEEAAAEVLGLTTAHQIWLSLEAPYNNPSVERIHLLRDSLRQLKKGTSSVSDYCRRFKALCDQLSAIGHPVVEIDKLHWFLCGLGPSYETFSTVVRATKPAPMFRDLVTQVESHELGRGHNRRPPHCQLCLTNGHYATTCPSLYTYVTQASPSSVDFFSKKLAMSICLLTPITPDWHCNAKVMFGNGKTLPITHTGSTTVSHDIPLRNVLVIPKLNKKLLS